MKTRRFIDGTSLTAKECLRRGLRDVVSVSNTEACLLGDLGRASLTLRTAFPLEAAVWYPPVPELLIDC